MKTYKDVFKEYCPICWESMERAGKINGKRLYICPICGMATNGRKADGHGEELVGAVDKV